MPNSEVELVVERDREVVLGTTETIISVPNVTIERTETDDGAVITVTDKTGTTSGTIYDGEQGPQGPEGPAYELTEEDKAEIAQAASSLVEVPTKLSQLQNDNDTVTDASYVHTDSNYTAAEKTKLAGITSEATKDAPYTSNPQMDGTASAGSSANFSRGDHVHPTDTSRAPIDSPALTGTPTAPTAASGDNSTQIATTAFTQAEIASHAYSLPLMTPDVRGGAKLEEHGGLTLRDGALGIGSLVQQSDGYARGGLAEITAKGHAEQVSTTGKNLLDISDEKAEKNGVTIVKTSTPSITLSGTSTSSSAFIIGTTKTIPLTNSTTYTLSIDEAMANSYVQINEDVNGTLSRLAKVSSGSVTFTTSSDASVHTIFVGVTTTGATSANVRIQLELGSTATEYEPYTGGAPSPSPDYPQEIRVAKGRNLLDATAVTSGKYLASGGTETSSADYSISDYVPVEVGATYVTSGMGAVSSAYYAWYTSAKAYISATQQTADGFTLTAPSNAAYVRVSLLNASLGTSQLELGSTPTPYVPYGHVGLDVTLNGVTTTTPIPLPPKGWAGGLTGVADELRIDAAGKVEWTDECGEIILDGSVDEDWRYSSNFACHYTPDLKNLMKRNGGDTVILNALSNRFIAHTINATLSNNGLFSSNASGDTYFKYTDVTSAADFVTWLSTHPVTVLYSLATPVTHEMGYVDMPDTPSDSTVDIPELSQFGCRFWVDADGSIHALAAAYEQRTLAEVAEARTAALANVAPVEGNTASTNYAQGTYLVHDGKLCKVTSAIATGETIAIGTNVAATTVAAEILAINE